MIIRMMIVMIAIDRYYGATKPFSNMANRSSKKALRMIGIAWGVSFIIWVIPIVTWKYVSDDHIDIQEGECYIEFLQENLAMSILASILSFYLPTCVICILFKGYVKKLFGKYYPVIFYIILGF